MKIRTEINERETKKAIEKINETKSWLLEKINKIVKSLARFTKKKREDENKVRNEREDVATDVTKIQRIMRDY